MDLDQSSGNCKHCEKQVRIQRSGTNHTLHFILSVCTGGLWIFIWILASLKLGGWKCATCGRGVSLWRKWFHNESKKKKKVVETVTIKTERKFLTGKKSYDSL